MTTESAKLHKRYLPTGYKKHNVFVSHLKGGDKINVSSYYRGGSRECFHLIHKVEGTIINPDVDQEGKYYVMKKGDVSIRGMGKAATAHIIYCDI